MPYLKSQKPELLERGISALCYISGGLIGLIYILLSGKYSNSSFFRFHFLQSIILGIFTYLLSWTAAIVKGLLIGIFGLIFSLFAPAAGLLAPIDWGIDGIIFLIRSVALLLLVYGSIFALLGRYAEIPVLSKLIYKQI